MAHESTLESLPLFSTQYARAIDQACAEAKWENWKLPQRGLAEALRRSAEKNFRDKHPSDAQVEVYLESLHLQDLGLACACTEGCEVAWEYFISNFRDGLRASAAAILRGSGGGAATRADELADSVYAELYGVSSSGAEKRKSLFEYFHGRSKLSTWLRTVLAKRHMDLLRTGRRTVSLDTEEEESPRQVALAVDPIAADPDREKYLALFEQALSTALAGLTPRKCMLLAQYYVDGLTLAEIGRILREHESTISRQLGQVRRELRESVTQLLRVGGPQPRLAEAQVALVFEYALGDWPFDLSRALAEGGKGTGRSSDPE